MKLISRTKTPRRRVVARPPRLRASARDHAVGLLACLWLLACVSVGATNLRTELHDLGLD
ncbi:MAG: hypothetical protein V4710_13635 [Verrucomicrobiota bacterium]